MMTNTVRKFGVGVATAALVAGVAAPALAAQSQEVPGPYDGAVQTGRIGGYDRVETAIKIAEEAFGKKNAEVEVVYLASAATEGAVDSAAAGHLSDGPIYLVDGSKRSAEAVAKSINEKFPNVQKVWAIGGTKAVSDDALKNVADAVSATTGRIGGADRYATAVEIAKHGLNNKGLSKVSQFVNTGKVYIARGDNPVDALVSGVLDDAPVLLLGPEGTVPASTEAFLKENTPSHFVALGGEGAVPTSAFGKVETDPVIKNVWVNDATLKKAQADLADAKFLLYGVDGANGVNPNIKVATAGLTTTQKDLIQAQIDALVEKLYAGSTNNTESNPDAGTLLAALNSAKSTAIGANANAEKATLDAADRKLNGVGTSMGKTTDTDALVTSAARTSANTANGDYSGSVAGVTVAENNLAKAKAIQKAVDAINAAVAKYNGLSSADQQASANISEFVDAVKPYLAKYNASNTATAVSGVSTKAAVDAIVALWENATFGGLKGFTAATAASGTVTALANSVPAANNAFEATADLAKNFWGVANSNWNLATNKAEEAPSVADATAALDGAKSLKAQDQAAYDAAKAAYDAKVASLIANNQAVKDAQAAVDEAYAQIAALRAQLANGGGSDAFMGYDRIERLYSSIDGVYANWMTESKAKIDREVSELVNAKTGTPAQVAADADMVAFVKAAYGIDLTGSNVEKFFSFKLVDGVQQVTRANHAKMSAENDALVAKAKELIDQFYALNAEGFNTGDMITWFGHRAGYSSKYAGYGKLTDNEKALVDGAAKAVYDALVTGASRSWDGTSYTNTYTINPGAFDGAYRTAHYLETVALANKKSAEEAYNKALLAYRQVVNQLTPKRYDRLEGKTRYQTSAAIAGYWRATQMYQLGIDKNDRGEKGRIYVANGDTYIDAVAGGQLQDGPIVLANAKGELEDSVKQRFAFARTDAKVLTITALGGTQAVPDSTLDAAKTAAFDKSLLSQDFFPDATKVTLGNAADAKTGDKAGDTKTETK